MAIYVVKSGDTLSSIAAGYSVTVDRLASDNQIPYPYSLAVGQALFVPEEGTGVPGREIIVNGYAYPFVTDYVLRQTLDYLTTLSVFSYGFTAEGELISPTPSDARMRQLALGAGVETLLVIAPIDSEGRFNNNLIHSVVQNPQYRQNLQNGLLAEVQAQGFAGVDVDFEYILAGDRDYFTLFVQELTTLLNAQGYQVSVALAPKTSASQQGLLYEGKDYAALGSAANLVMPMTYEWGYRYSEPMAVAPINKVRQVIEYTTSVIPRDKILLGVPNYGYDWPLPYVKGQTAALTIGNAEAVQIAVRNNAVIQFDETAQSPWFTYESEGISHEVWFEDVRSYQAKFDLINEFSLRGFGVWQVTQLFRAGWLQMAENFVVSPAGVSDF